MGLGLSEFAPSQQTEIERIFRARQGVLRGTPDGPVVDLFDPQELAQAIEQELERCATRGWHKVVLQMDVRDALLLARYLRSGQA